MITVRQPHSTLPPDRVSSTPAPPRPSPHASRSGGSLEEPSLVELAERFEQAVLRWAKAGFKTVSREGYKERADICNACPQWDGKARKGLGKCTDTRCGCTRFKRWLATEKCPQGKWPA